MPSGTKLASASVIAAPLWNLDAAGSPFHRQPWRPWVARHADLSDKQNPSALAGTHMALTLLGRNDQLASTTEQLKILAETKACPPFETKLHAAGLTPFHATGVTILQITSGSSVTRHAGIATSMRGRIGKRV